MSTDYDSFILSIKSNRPSNEYFEGSEQHHIIPKSHGGTDEQSNLIYLTYAEHFTAHKLLVASNPTDRRMAYALWRMANGKHECSPDDYENAKRAFMSTKVSDETRQKMRLAHIGKSSGMLGKRHSELSKVKMSQAQKHREKRVVKKGWLLSNEAKDKHRQLYNRFVYHILCRSCGKEFIADKPCFRYCDDCRNRRTK